MTEVPAFGSEYHATVAAGARDHGLCVEGEQGSVWLRVARSTEAQAPQEEGGNEEMNVAVLTLTRERLAYTQHCFARLREFAGCGFDHFVLDQASEDGTYDWVKRHVTMAIGSSENLGISRGLNLLLDVIDTSRYDVIVKFDNDCELTQPNTLRDVCRLALAGNALLSPRILGLNNPPSATGAFVVGGEEILDIPQIGGIFLAAPAHIYQQFRYAESDRLDDHDDVQLCWWWRGQGGRCGYVKRLEAWHYETTDGQHARFPDYYERQLQERRDASDHRAVRA